MRISRPWLVSIATLFGVYLLALVFFVVDQANAQSRHVIWHHMVNRWSVSEASLGNDGMVLLRHHSGELQAFSPEGGKLWEHESDRGFFSFDANQVQQMDDGSLLMIEDSNAPMSFTAPGMGQGQTAQQPDQRIIHIGTDGEKLAEIEPDFPFDSSYGVCVLDGQLGLKDSAGQLRAIDMQGTTLWQSQAMAGIHHIAGPDGDVLLMDVNSVSSAAELSRVDSKGELLWQITLPGDYGNCLRSAGDRIWYVDTAGLLRCLDGDGRELWQFQGQHNFEVSGVNMMHIANMGIMGNESLDVQEDGRAAIVDSRGQLYILDADGNELSRCQLSSSGGNSIAIDLERERVVIADYNGMRVMDMQGRELLSNGFIRSHYPPLIDRERRQAYILDDSSLYCMEY